MKLQSKRNSNLPTDTQQAALTEPAPTQVLPAQEVFSSQPIVLEPPLSQNTAPPSPTTEKKFSPTVIAAIVVSAFVILGGLGIVYAVFYKTRIKPAQDFNPQEHAFTYTRDADADKVPEIPLADLFSAENIDKYQKGDGLTITLIILNDPRSSSPSSPEVFKIEKATDIRIKNRPRKDMIAAKKIEIEEAVARFLAPIPVPRMVEIGVDDTSGITPAIQTLIQTRIMSMAEEFTSEHNPTTIFLFRLTSTDYKKYKTLNIEKGTSKEQALAIVQEHMAEWLKEDTGTKPVSSLATGLFNVLRVNEKVRKRKIIIFSDGLENHPDTAKFYWAKYSDQYLDKSRWAAMDIAISKFKPFPNLNKAEVTWFYPPQDWIQYNTVQQYWEHVMVEKCGAASCKTEY